MSLAPDTDKDAHLPELDWHERMRSVDEAYEFYPTTREELNIAYGALPFQDVPGGVGGHLQEIFLHQRTHEVKDPDRAVRAHIRKVGAYFADADIRQHKLLVLHEQLDDVNPEETVGLIEDLDMTGLLSAVQYAHVKNGVQRHDGTPIQGGIKIPRNGTTKRLVTRYDPETHDAFTTEILMGNLLDETVVSMKSLVTDAGMSHVYRRDFWETLLRSARSHGMAKKIIDTILTEQRTA